MANPNSKDPLRREAYLLKQLQTVYAWRGVLVDSVIQKQIVPKMRHHKLPSENQVLEFATQLMNKQISFGIEKKYRGCNVTKSGTDDAYCAFYELEYDKGLDKEKLEGAKDDIISSLKNLLHSNLLKEITTSNTHIIAQRELTFQFDRDVDVSCTPDLIVFFEGKSPLIVDWKVHSYSSIDAWLQLGIYAIALLKVKPHKDFPNGLTQVGNPSNVQLIEYQLLKNIQREYRLSAEDVADIEDYIFQSSIQMKKLVNGRKYDRLDVSQFQTAHSPKICEKCQFKKLCWKETSFQKRLFEGCL
jgi:CRISPR/Cas system-associated exonuclease Cas4 (RecB family)